MEWKLFADLAEVAGSKRIPIDAESGVTVGTALDRLLDDHPALADRVLEEGELGDHINVLHNGTNIVVEDGLETPIEEGDELALFPPVSGG